MARAPVRADPPVQFDGESFGVQRRGNRADITYSLGKCIAQLVVDGPTHDGSPLSRAAEPGGRSGRGANAGAGAGMRSP